MPDDIYRIRAAVSEWIADPEVNAVISTGGTGVTGRDGTPEAVNPLLDKAIDGFGEVFRNISYDEIRTSTIPVPSAGRSRQRDLRLLPSGGRRVPVAPLGTNSSSISSTTARGRATSSS